MTCEADDGDRILGFGILKVDEEIYGVGFVKGLRKTHRFEGRIRLLDGFVQAIAMAFDGSEVAAERDLRGLVEVVKAAVVLG